MELKDKKTQVIFHAGILTIGGTVIEIAYEDSHIFFDFGTEFKPELKLKDESLQSLIEHRLVPELEHMYDPALGYVSKEDNTFNHTAVFLSHCHLDHTRMINYLDPQVPLYALNETKILVESLNAKNDFLLPNVNPEKPFTRDIIGVDNETVVTIGDIQVKLKRVDHDAYGACGMIITTPDMHITYTGDLRLHGFDDTDTLKFANDAKDTDMLIIEGVSLSFDPRPDAPANPIVSEQDLLNRVLDTVKEYEGKQTTFSLYPGNVRRIAEFVKQVPRQVVLEASFAYVLKQCLDMDAYYYTLPGQDFGLKPEYEIDLSVLTEDEGHYFWQITQDFEKLKGGGVYIHSDATPLGEFDPTYLPFIQKLDSLGVEFKRLACSGHALPEDLDKIVSLIQPKCLIPIHTLRPEKLENPYGERHLVKRGEVL